MSQDPRRFTTKSCPNTQNANVNETSKRRDFFDALGKVGDVEALNRVGLGTVGTGLRTLTSLSNSVRTGDTDPSTIPTSASYVLSTVGIDPNAVAQASNFNPGVVNRATAQAESILTDVRGGNYNLTDIPTTFTELQNLKSLTDGIYTSGSDQRREVPCDPSPYAFDLISRAPKFKFLFVVQITLSTAYQSAMGDAGKNLAFVVKNSTRPNVNIEHEEINMYNFWTRIPKRADYEPITMRFLDDDKGLAHLFYTTYLRSISPITRFEPGFDSVDWLQTNSMNLNRADLAGAASLTALEGNTTSIISDIKLFHLFNYGKEMNVYSFKNPKLLTMNLDELDMAESTTGSEIELQFAYDALHINPGFSIKDRVEHVTSMSGGSVGAMYPIVPNFLDTDSIETPEGVDSEGNPLTPDITNTAQDNFDAGNASSEEAFSLL